MDTSLLGTDLCHSRDNKCGHIDAHLLVSLVLWQSLPSDMSAQPATRLAREEGRAVSRLCRSLNTWSHEVCENPGKEPVKEKNLIV